jgi:cardiolipin hydrolase
VDVCVFTITDDEVSDAMVQAMARGVEIRVITDDLKSQDMGSDVGRLKRVEIPLRMDKSDYHMHHKFALFDQSILLTGSYNWTRSAFKYNEENIVVTRDKRLRRAFSQEFEQLWEKLA